MPSTAPRVCLEHVNVTVSDPDRTAAMLETVFGWKVRWSGPAIDGGRSVHVGDDDTYLALYAAGERPVESGPSYRTRGGLNHIAVVVDDLSAIEARLKAAGVPRHNYGDYEPGRRFYFNDRDGIEFEVVSYT